MVVSALKKKKIGSDDVEELGSLFIIIVFLISEGIFCTQVECFKLLSSQFIKSIN